MKKPIIVLIMLIAVSMIIISKVSGQDIRITQIDTNALLFRGEFDIYFTLPGGPQTEPASADFSVSEAEAGELEIKKLDNKPNVDAGIDFMLLIDNSGSMYDESYQGSSRISQAKIALNSFLDQIDQSNQDKKSLDRVAVYSFNTKLQEIASLGTPIADIRRRLSEIERPEAEMAYTELYNSLIDVSGRFEKSSGRRSIIVLSDGENYPFMGLDSRGNPDWGTTAPTPSNIISTAQAEGISIDGINISDSMDSGLGKICEAGGGEFYDVRSTAAISQVYNSIRDRITSEYRLTVTAPPLGDGRGELLLRYNGASDSRTLLIPLLFGGTSELPVIVGIILLLIGLTGIVVLYIIPFDKPVKTAQIQSLNSHQKTILNEGATIIGASREADHTIAGNPGIDAQHATIVHDEKTGEYTLMSEKVVRVNNRKVKNRKLSPGDVIRIEGSTVIFDAPENT